jgi:hypothetical protein
MKTPVTFISSLICLCLACVFYAGYSRFYFFRKAGSVYFPQNQNWWSDYLVIQLFSVELCARNAYVVLGGIMLLFCFSCAFVIGLKRIIA